MRGSNADTIQANMRSLLETSEYHRRLAKVVGLKEIIDDPKSNRRQKLLNEIADFRKKGMLIDVETGEIHVETRTSWIISSARFGSEMTYGKPLLSLGDIDRYRWRSHLPDRQERIRITSEVGSLPPTSTNAAEIKAISEAWRIFFSTMKRVTEQKLFKLHQDEYSYYKRKEIWDQTQKELAELYPNMDEAYVDQLVNLRARAEFRRLMLQHAALKQFERDQGYDSRSG